MQKEFQFSKILPLPKNKYNHSQPQVKLQPFKHAYLPMDADEYGQDEDRKNIESDKNKNNGGSDEQT